jgi:hypothetical protein
MRAGADRAVAVPAENAEGARKGDRMKLVDLVLTAAGVLALLALLWAAGQIVASLVALLT